MEIKKIKIRKPVSDWSNFNAEHILKVLGEALRRGEEMPEEVRAAALSAQGIKPPRKLRPFQRRKPRCPKCGRFVGADGHKCAKEGNRKVTPEEAFLTRRWQFVDAPPERVVRQDDRGVVWVLLRRFTASDGELCVPLFCPFSGEPCNSLCAGFELRKMDNEAVQGGKVKVYCRPGRFEVYAPGQ